MKIAVSIIIFIVISFFNIGAFTKDLEITQDSFAILEKNIENISEFEENGAKVQYKTKDSIEEETIRIEKYFMNNLDVNFKKTDENQFKVYNKSFNIDVKLWHKNDYTFVEVILINKNNKYTTSNLKSILKNLENDKVENIQYFLYYEGEKKELDNNYLLNQLVDENNIKNMDILNINNGSIGTGYLSDENKINLALIKYNTGYHIIIGTPIIFVPY